VLEIGFPLRLERGTVILRQWTAADFEFYAAHLGDKVTAQYIGGAIDKQKAWRHLASLIGHWTLRGFGVYACEDRASGRLLGSAGLWQPHGWPCREFAFWFRPEAYGGDCAAEAAQLALDHVRVAFPDEQVTGFIHPENRPALALAGRLGGIAEGEVTLFDFGLHVQIAYRPSTARSASALTPTDEENAC
jgi:RimJ/RimL family protein N-acetyltransferase